MEHFVIRIIIVSLALTMLTASVSCRFVHLIEDYDQPMTEMVAVCRKGCLLKFLIRPITGFVAEECSRRSNCFMCWDYCSLLYQNRKRKMISKMMCSDDICFAGCKFACNYLQYLLAKPMQRANFFQ